MLGASPTPRPAGRDLAFVRDGDIWLSNLGGTGSLQLTHDGRDSEPHWAPDGRRLLFLRGKGAEAELYSIGADGSELRRLTNDRLEQKSPRWAPQGGLIAYVQPREAAGDGAADPDKATEIWTAHEDGSAARKLVDGFDPAWSPDGLRLAYATNGTRQAGPPAGAIDNALHLVNALGRNDAELLPLGAIPRDLEPAYNLPFRPATRELRAPSWAADGRHLSATADGHTGLALTVDDKGADLKFWVLNYEGGVGRSDFAPRGNRLAVESRPASGFAHVVVVDMDSDHKAEIGSEKLSYSAVEPAWAPDGEHLAVVTFSGAVGNPAGRRELLVFGSDGTAQSRVAVGNISRPAWNPLR